MALAVLTDAPSTPLVETAKGVLFGIPAISTWRTIFGKFLPLTLLSVRIF